MKNILIPTDFSGNAYNAIKYSQQLFKNHTCNIFILHVANYVEYPAIASENQGDDDTDILDRPTSSKKRLSELVRLIQVDFFNKRHNYIAVHDSGFFIDSIRKHVKENDIDLIVMGTKGASGLRQRIVGSNTGDAITKVQCNALVVPNGVDFKKPREVAFPTDFNIFYSHKILEAISEVLQIGEGNIRIMNVIKSNGVLNTEQQKNKDFLFDYLDESFPHKKSFHTITNKSVNAAIQCFVESRDIDMIVMVAKNLNFLQQILFDTLVEKVSFHTKVPFLVIHE